jgi:thioesterase domain-containing protein
VAFEVAAQLEAEGQTVGAVALLDAELPVARVVHSMTRLSGFLKQAMTDPMAVKERSLKILRKVINGKRSAAGASRVPASDAPIDMSVEGSQADAAVSAYESLGRVIRGKLLTFRATKNDIPAWITIEPDLGWSGRSGQLSSYDVPSSHLGIVRAPHAAQVASLLVSAKR